VNGVAFRWRAYSDIATRVPTNAVWFSSVMKMRK
jgi:hypothetical protein